LSAVAAFVGIAKVISLIAVGAVAVIVE